MQSRSPRQSRTTRSTRDAKLPPPAIPPQMAVPKMTRVALPRGITVADVMTSQPVTIGRTEPLAVAHAMMREHAVRHLPVLEHGELVGVLSQRDLYFLETIAGVDTREDSVDDAMSQETYAVSPATLVSEVAGEMAKRRFGCAVVMERGRVAGIFTATDALRLLGAQGKTEGALG